MEQIKHLTTNEVTRLANECGIPVDAALHVNEYVEALPPSMMRKVMALMELGHVFAVIRNARLMPDSRAKEAVGFICEAMCDGDERQLTAAMTHLQILRSFDESVKEPKQ